jgi:hypothetical protein
MASAIDVSPSYVLVSLSSHTHSQLREAFEDRVTFIVYRLIDLCRWSHFVEHANRLSYKVIDQLSASLSSSQSVLLDTLLRVHREQAV